jgi:DNA-binding GntR family transcriptional regulator
VSPVRSKPQQIHDHYADLIDRGQLAVGQFFPSMRAIAHEQGTGLDAAREAVGMLAGGGRIEKEPNGGQRYIVSQRARENVTAPMDRARGLRLITAPGVAESIEVTTAEMVIPPEYVAGILGVEPTALVIRREEIASRDGAPMRLTVHWIPDVIGESVVCGHLLDRQVVEGGVLGCIQRATGRKATFVRESDRAEGADGRESRLLLVPFDSPVRGMVDTYCDAKGVLLYEETVWPRDRVVTRTYELGDED